jgi:hypothetical protein
MATIHYNDGQESRSVDGMNMDFGQIKDIIGGYAQYTTLPDGKTIMFFNEDAMLLRLPVNMPATSERIKLALLYVGERILPNRIASYSICGNVVFVTRQEFNHIAG